MKRIKVFFTALLFALFLSPTPNISKAEECNEPFGGCVLSVCGCVFKDICLLPGCTDIATGGGNTIGATADVFDTNSCLIGPRQVSAKCGGCCGAPVPNVCGENRCANVAEGSGFNGVQCEIDADSDNTGVKCSANGNSPKYGKWDASQGACITCNALNQEINRLGWGTGNFYCNGNVAGAQTGKFDSACGANASCDEKSSGDACSPPAGGTCSLSGKCEVAIGLVLTATASPASIAVGGTSTITFDVTQGGIHVGNVDVQNITVSGGGSISATTCQTKPLADPKWGTCEVTYTAPGASTTATISALKAVRAGYGDSGPASTNVVVTTCSPMTFVKFLDTTVDMGDNFSIQYAIASSEPSNDYVVCLYNPSVSSDDIEHINHGLGSGNMGTINSESASSVGTWTVTLNIGISCPGAPTGCIASAEVTTGGGGGGGGGGGCSNVCDGIDSGAGCSAIDPDTPGACVSPGCATDMDCCTNDPTICVAPSICNPSTGACQACVEDGDTATSATMCCPGLSWIGGACTSACDYGLSFFCNPLRGTVEDIVQGGQKLIGYVLGLVGSIALLFIVIAGMMYMTSAGNEERIASSKRILTGAIIGIAITLLAYSFLQVIITILNM